MYISASPPNNLQPPHGGAYTTNKRRMSMVTMRECKQKVLDWVSNYMETLNDYVIENVARNLYCYLQQQGCDTITIEATKGFDLDAAIIEAEDAC